VGGPQRLRADTGRPLMGEFIARTLGVWAVRHGFVSIEEQA
jgi:hypothetical protein